MPQLDATAKAAVGGPGFAPAWFIWLDIGTDDLRVTNYGQPVTFSGTGDADLDGFTFLPFGGPLLEVGDVSNSETGSESLAITLSGIVSIDATLVADIGDKTLWQGRTGRLWSQIYDADGLSPQGAIVAHYTGYMSRVGLTSEVETQTIQLSLENYLSFYSQPSNRSYLNQKDYDAADASAAATMTCANGLRRDTGAGAGGGAVGLPGGGGLFGGGSGFVGMSPGITMINGVGVGGGSYGAIASDGWDRPSMASR